MTQPVRRGGLIAFACGRGTPTVGKIEEFHKSVKSNTGYSLSPAHRVRSQSNHLFRSMLAFVKLEALQLSTSKDNFALKTLLTLNATKLALRELDSPKSRSTLIDSGCITSVSEFDYRERQNQLETLISKLRT